MKTDTYLHLCLEQAANSPLRYRHGCIIVRGGKVIGQGFNDYRAGFNGGALKTGRLPLRALDGAALAELKNKRKLKRESKAFEEETTKTFTPFETMSGGGRHANTPLSMHSEMMAIHSALSASSTMASTTVSSQKPGFKLSGDSKRKARLRRDAIKVQPRSSAEASLMFKSGDLKALHLNRAKLDLALQLKADEDAAWFPENSIEKHQVKNQKQLHQYNGNKHNTQHNQQRRQYARKLSAQGSIKAPCHSAFSSSVVGIESLNDKSKRSKEACNLDVPKLSAKKSKERSDAPDVKSQPILLPKGHAGRGAHGVSERMKHPRLHGADLYVARLGWKSIPIDNIPNVCCASSLDSHSISTDDSKPSTGSLHDELLNPYPRALDTAPSSGARREPSVLASRPCYRCISYMNSVGIKRVFWTTDSGNWECAKVRDLVDELDKIGLGGPTDDATALNNIFVTKHEVLMLRRTMGDT